MARAGLFATIRTEGGLLPSGTLAVIGGNDASAFPGLLPASYHLEPGESLAAAITKSWNALLGHWANFQAALASAPPSDGTTTTITRERWLLPLFRELDYGRLQQAKPVTVGETTYPISHLWGSTPVHLVGSRVPIGERTPGVKGAAGMSPHSLVQELINRSSEYLWGVVSNGLQLRLLRDNANLTRQAYVEWDLQAMFDGQVYPDFVVLWKVLHQSRVEGERPADCWLERWANEASAQGVRALDLLRAGVEQALTELGRGFITHPANAVLRSSLSDGSLDASSLYRQLLRLVYRLIFLAVAEERSLLHPAESSAEARARYGRYYSLRRLRQLSERRRGGAHGDLWQALRLVVKALGSPDGLPQLGLAGLGSMLWSEKACPDLEPAEISNRYLLRAVRALSFVEDKEARQLRPVDYRNLGPEELGSVYESLLELHPRVSAKATDTDESFSLGTAAGHERKTTGSYYTPSSLISSLMDTALEPVLDEATSKADPEAALLALRVVDPACGSGHFLIAAAHRIARRLASVRTGEPEPAPEALRAALRDVIGRCVHGVDVNPMAAELCKVSLWMEALEPGKPLSFLDHRIVVGNALIGATPELLEGGVPDEAFAVLTGDDKAVVSELKKRNKNERTSGQAQLGTGWDPSADTKALAGEILAIDSLPDNTLAGVAEKEERLRSLEEGERRLARLRADAWCAAFVLPKKRWTIQFTDGVWHTLVANPGAATQPVLDAIERAKEAYGFLHWHVEFADVMANGGFDLVVGNPPWDKVEFHEKEFFAARDTNIAEAAGANRKKLIAQLEVSDPPLWAAYQSGQVYSEATNHFLRNSGRFPLCGLGRLNTYAVFAEMMRSLLGPTGRAGAILPTGIATDDTTKAFFGAISGGKELVSLYGFYDRKQLFTGADVHAFCLLTIAGRGAISADADFAFFCRRVDDLEDAERRFKLSAEEITLLNPNTRTCPVFRSRRDAEITLGIYRRVPVLLREGDPGGNPWGIRFRQGLFNMTSDSGLFRTREDLEGEGFTLKGNVFRKGKEAYLPLYEGKMVHHFDHRWATYDDGDFVDMSVQRKADPAAEPLPRYWVTSEEVDDRLAGWEADWLLGFRDIARATDERTVIAGVIPRCAVGNNLPLLLWEASVAQGALLSASLSSAALDFVARQKVGGTHLNFFLVEQLPVLPPDVYSRPAAWDPERSVGDWLVPRVLELTYTAVDMAPFARDLGYTRPPFRWDDERRASLRGEIDACFFHLYGLERDEVDYVMRTFPIVQRRDNERFGEYRTKRLIMECYDALDKAAQGGEPFVSTIRRD